MAERNDTSQDTSPRMAAAVRHVYGPRPVSALLPAITRPAFRRMSPAAAQIMIDWAAIIGPALSVVTFPRRLADGQMTIACSGPIALELQHLAPEIMARINGHVGSAAVRSLRFVQSAIPRKGGPNRPRKPPNSPPSVTQAATGGPEGPLEAALAALGRAVLAEEAK